MMEATKRFVSDMDEVINLAVMDALKDVKNMKDGDLEVIGKVIKASLSMQAMIIKQAETIEELNTKLDEILSIVNKES